MERWRSRGFLPHVDALEATQFITWRLADSIPVGLWEEWHRTYCEDNPDRRHRIYRLAEEQLDSGFGEALLRRPELASVVLDTVLEHHQCLYSVMAVVAMPNHMHAVLRMAPDAELSKVVQLIKGASAHEINRHLGRKGRFWQPDYFDRVIRSPEHLQKCVHYVHWNPVKAKLAVDPRWYPFSTANPRYAERVGGSKLPHPDAD